MLNMWIYLNLKQGKLDCSANTVGNLAAYKKRQKNSREWVGWMAILYQVAPAVPPVKTFL